MRNALLSSSALPAMTPAAIQNVRAFEDKLLEKPQIDLKMRHVIHAGIYSRTLFMPKGLFMTGAPVKIPTLLTLQGDVMVWIGQESVRYTGYAVLPAAAHRKQMFRTFKDTHITMAFATQAKTVAEAEREFTDEAERLASRRDEAHNETVITGD